MAELRRLFIQSQRLKVIQDDQLLFLKAKEAHYLKRVLRLRVEDRFAVVDGEGHLWEAKISQHDKVELLSSFLDPQESKIRPKPLLCLAVVIPKQGIEGVFRMCCEIGIDIFQPLWSERRISKGESLNKFKRWEEIIKEATEQSERLWMPELRRSKGVISWLKETISNRECVSFATTRLDKASNFQLWMEESGQEANQLWVVIGPEGGWSSKEQKMALDLSCCPITLGETILRTSTAAISASQLMASWRQTYDYFGR